MFYFIYLGTLFENFNEALLFDKNKWVELSMEDRKKLKKEIRQELRQLQ